MKTRDRSKRVARPTRDPRRLARAIVLAVPAVVAFDATYVIAICPDWSELSEGPYPKSRFIREYEEARRDDRSLPKLRWRPVPLDSIPEPVQRVFLAAEDAGFYDHPGVDFRATWDAVKSLVGHRRIEFGASTVTQQTIKNLVFENERSFVRKWHEMILALWMERALPKRRILGIYLNIVELGPGIYGVDAAARAYFGVSASSLSVEQAIELAATLPSPRANNPRTRTERFLKRVDKIAGFVKDLDLGSGAAEPDGSGDQAETAPSD